MPRHAMLLLACLLSGCMGFDECYVEPYPHVESAEPPRAAAPPWQSTNASRPIAASPPQPAGPQTREPELLR